MWYNFGTAALIFYQKHKLCFMALVSELDAESKLVVLTSAFLLEIPVFFYFSCVC